MRLGSHLKKAMSKGSNLHFSHLTKLSELGELVGGIEYTAVAMAIRRFEQRLARDKKLAAQTQEAKAQLCKVKGVLPKM